MLPFKHIDWKNLSLEGLSRKIIFPFPLQEIGFIRSLVMPEMEFRDKLEFTIRFSAQEKSSIEIIDGVRYETRFPNFVSKVPGVIHQYAVLKPRDSLYFAYSPSLSESMRQAGLFPNPPVREVNITPEVTEMIRELMELMEHSLEYGVADRMDLLAFRLLQELLLQRCDSLHGDAFYESKMAGIASYFQMNFTKKLEIDKICRKNGFSRSSFFRHWKACYGKTPMLYLQELKLKEGCRLLKNTNQKIGEITTSLSFQDPAYFCAIFKKQYGMTPLQYRKKTGRGKII